MRRFNFHITTKEQRDALLAMEGEIIPLEPEQITKQPIYIWDNGLKPDEMDTLVEAAKAFVHHYHTEEMILALPVYQNHKDIPDLRLRLLRLQELVNDVKVNGIQVPIVVEETGERIDGSYRSAVAQALNIPLPARLVRMPWQLCTQEWLERKLEALERAYGHDYYAFTFPNGLSNYPSISPDGMYENASRERLAEIIRMIGNRTSPIFDLGCNAGYISIQLARAGYHVWGVDRLDPAIANTYRLAFEFCDQKEINAHFEMADLDNPTFHVPRFYKTVLLLNVIYHLKNKVEILRKLKGKRLIFQCNLRKEHQRQQYYGSHPDDLIKLLEEAGITTYKVFEWRDKPFVVAQ